MKRNVKLLSLMVSLLFVTTLFGGEREQLLWGAEPHKGGVRFKVSFHSWKQDCKRGFNICILGFLGDDMDGGSHNGGQFVIAEATTTETTMYLTIPVDGVRDFEGGAYRFRFEGKRRVCFDEELSLEASFLSRLGVDPHTTFQRCYPVVRKGNNYVIEIALGR